MRSKLSFVQPNSDEGLDLQKKIERASAELQSVIEDMKQRFRWEEARMCAESYDSVINAVKAEPDERGIGLDFRFGSERMDRSKPENILQNLNRPVVYQRHHDIASAVLAYFDGVKQARQAGTNDVESR